MSFSNVVLDPVVPVQVDNIIQRINSYPADNLRVLNFNCATGKLNPLDNDLSTVSIYSVLKQLGPGRQDDNKNAISILVFSDNQNRQVSFNIRVWILSEPGGS